MSTELLALGLDLTWKATLVVAIALVASRLPGRGPLRYGAWTAAVVLVLCLPGLRAVAPSWNLPVLQADAARDASASTSPAEVLLAIWAIGAAFFLVRLVRGLGEVQLRAARAIPAKPERWPADELTRGLGITRPVRVLESQSTESPCTFGLLRPVVLVPASARAWPAELRRTALLHELVHVARRDWLVLVAARVACALYWFHPLVWMAANRVRLERELACDAGVVERGVAPSEYALHLFAIASDLCRGDRAPAAALGIGARRSQLEARLLALRDARTTAAGPRAGAVMLPVLFTLSFAGLALGVAGADPVSRGTVEPHPHAEPAEPEPNPKPQDATGSLEGTWHVRIGAGEPWIRLGADAQSGANVDVVELDLTAFERASLREHLFDGAVGFSIARDAGSLRFEGEVRGSRGEGRFTFTANEGFASWLRKRGVGQPNARTLFALARDGASYRLLERELARAVARGEAFDLDALTALAPRRPQKAETRKPSETARALTIDQIIELHARGVAPETARDLTRLGFTHDEVLRCVRVGVGAAFVEELSAAGLERIDIDVLERFARSDVEPGYARALAGAGLAPMSADDVLRLAGEGVTPRVVQALALLAGSEVSADDVASVTLHRVDAPWLDSLAHLAPLVVDDVVRLARSNVDAEVVVALRDAGVDPPSVDELVRLAQSGISATWVTTFTEETAEASGPESPAPVAPAALTPPARGPVAATPNAPVTPTGECESSEDEAPEIPCDLREALEEGGYEFESEEVLQLARAGVEAAWLRELDEAEVRGLLSAELVRLWRAGVKADYLGALVKSGLAPREAVHESLEK